MTLPPTKIDQFATASYVERAVYEAFLGTLIPRNPTHLLTVGLMPTGRCLNAHRWNVETTSARENLAYYLITRLDRQLYGRLHNLLAPEKKFDFLIRTESADRYGNTIPAHLHGYLSIPNPLLDAFYTKWCGFAPEWEGIDSKLALKASTLGFCPDVMMQEYYAVDPIRDGYGIKRGHENVNEIWTRATMKSEKDRSSAGCP